MATDFADAPFEIVQEEIWGRLVQVIGGHEIVTKCPGRYDLSPGVADNFGARTFLVPMDRWTTFSARAIDEMVFRFYTTAQIEGIENPITITPEMLEMEPEELARHFSGPRHWGAYLAGTLKRLAMEGIKSDTGLEAAIHTDLPLNSAASSSAAMTMSAKAGIMGMYMPSIAYLTDQSMIPPEWGQWVENYVAGASCGIMDQAVGWNGVANEGFILDCHTREILPGVPIPEGLTVFGIFSGVKHSVAGHGTENPYEFFRKSARATEQIFKERGILEKDQSLAHLTPEEFEKAYRDAGIPHYMKGSYFNDPNHFGPLTDPLPHLKLEDNTDYALYDCAKLCVGENERTLRLKAAMEAKDLEWISEVINERDLAYDRDGHLGHPDMKILTDMARAAGIPCITSSGGGTGGMGVGVCRSDQVHLLPGIAHDYSERTGNPSFDLTGSSHGALLAYQQMYN